MSANDIATIKEWLSKQQHLPDVDDHLIRRFLTCCDHSLEKTKTTMDHFFCLRADTPEFFSDRDPLQPKMQEVFTQIDLLPLPQLTPEGLKCFLYRLADPNPDKFVFNEYAKCFFLVGDTRVKTETVIPKGEIIIFDMKGYSLRHLTKLHFPSLRKYMQYTQEAHPVRLKQIHVINVSSLLDKTMTLVKPLLKAEVAGMLHFHQPESKTLYDFVPKDILPDEYGGKAGTVSEIKETWKSKVEKNRDWFKTNPWIANNNKRLDKKNSINIMDGSFRTLTID
ncbi:alpha-tocopherol transfer protein-like [Cimex lectularius]|uniref:CRAL-TRIO domain-containing protein n=1 Tax=Cimex lectularius TaxID=79782 RepID=A0A8I6S600_CIMLE|nr:alpha-tocopherol transfer protein-like [Cimex lectularius]